MCAGFIQGILPRSVQTYLVWIPGMGWQISMEILRELELAGVGVNFSTASTYVYSCNLWILLGSHIFGIFLFYGLYIYYDQTHPGEFGV